MADETYLCIVAAKRDAAGEIAMRIAMIAPRIGSWNHPDGPDPQAPGFYICESPDNFRPATAGDFERFGFPCPGSVALAALRNIEREAVEGIQRLPRSQLACRGYLDDIRAEAARGLAGELASNQPEGSW